MKLEIKHLAPYLPYALKVLSSRGTVFILDTYSNMAGSGIEKREIQSVLNDGMKPLLNSILDLSTYLRNEFEKLDRGYAYDKIAVDLFCEENGIDEDIENIDLKSIPYECVEYMFENHYDVFGLIEKGLAININTMSVQNDG